MKAVILAAGRGTRMGDLTQDLPKPMIPVRGRPILEHIITGLRDHAAVTHILLITGYRAEVIENHFADGSAHRLHITYQRQTTQDGTGRVVELARHFTGPDPFILSYGDILVDPAAYAALVRPVPDAQGVITVKHATDVSKGGAVFFDHHRHLTDLREKPAPGEPISPWYNAGIYLLPPAIYTHTARLQKSIRGEYELTDALRTLAQSGDAKLHVLELPGAWADVRDPQILAQLNQTP